MGYVDAVTTKGKWIIEYYDNSSEIVDEERSIELREAHENMMWKRGRDSTRREGAGPRAGRYVDRKVRKRYKGHGWFKGKVTKYNNDDEQYEVEYTDGELYHLSEKKVKDILVQDDDTSI